MARDDQFEFKRCLRLWLIQLWFKSELALALNRDGKGEEAEKVLLDLIKKRGPSSETYGILGRVYKDRWEGSI